MLEDKLREALDNKNKDIKTFVWKGKKEEVSGMLMQKEKKLIEATEEELKEYYAHCKSMLHNTDKNFPGRYPLLDIIKEQRLKCNVELFLRWLQYENGISRYKFMECLRSFLDHNRGNYPNISKESISKAVNNCPQEFAEIPIESVIDGCLDRLGKFSKQHLTLTFILKQGLWLTDEDKKELTKNGTIAITNWKEAVKEELKLGNTNVDVKTAPTGLNLTQLRAMINLKSEKYSKLSVEQLETLRNRILFSLEETVRYHITQWETRKDQIRQVCEYKGITL